MRPDHQTDPLRKKLGIVGGGQLGKMMALEAKKLGFWIAILDPAEDCPAHSVTDAHIVAGFNDEEAIFQLAELADVMTYELEHIRVESLEALAGGGKPVYPTPKSLKIIQNKLWQKQALAQAGIPVPAFMPIQALPDMDEAGARWGYPYLLKACTGGYDGKGNALVRQKAGQGEAFHALGGEKGLVLMAEQYVDFAMEASVLACRGIDGKTAVYPVAQNLHEDNILRETRVPAALSAETAERAMDIAGRVMEVFDGVGMFCVELFIRRDGGLLVNEVAPRPHNSGHYTIEACDTSQFAQHIRAITGLPLGSTQLIRPAVMHNLLGDEDADGPTQVQGAAEALALPGVHLHIYGKREAKPKRKMGHLTALGDTLEEAAGLADKAYRAIKVTGKV